MTYYTWKCIVCSVIVCVFCSGLKVEEWNKRANDALERVIKINHNTNMAKNVIFFLGDGMGITTVTASRIYKGQKNGKVGELESLNFEKLPFVGLSKTFSNDRQVTESGASAVALLSGAKVNSGTLGLNSKAVRAKCDTQKGNEIKGLLNWSMEEGKATGIVTTTRITHATPAATYAHIVERYWENDAKVPKADRDTCKDIAAQLVDDNPNINVVMGGGRSNFLPKTMRDPEYPDTVTGSREDDRNLVEDWMKKKQTDGVSHAYVWNSTTFDDVDPESTDYLLGLFEPSHMRYSIKRGEDGAGEPTFADMVEKAIRIMSRRSEGYFLLAEGGRIDHAHHDNLPKLAMEDTISFDEGVARALSLTSEKDTLIIVTADHAHPFTLGSWASLNNSILGFVDKVGYDNEPALDNFPYLSLSYGNGPGVLQRQNLTGQNTEADDYAFPSRVPMQWDTHGGQDVAVYARGPMAHLVNGVQESNYFAYMMAYASCVGPRKEKCSRHDQPPSFICAAPGSTFRKPAYNMVEVIMLLLSFVCLHV